MGRMYGPLSPEYRLLARAVAPPGLADRSGRATVPPDDPPDWAEGLRLARWHRVSPLLSRHAKLCGEGTVPAGVQAELAGDRLRAGAENVCRLSALRKVTDALAQEGVAVMALKGVALLDLAYPDVSLRPMVDIDLLVPPDDIARAEAVILDLGFISARPAAADGTPGGPRQSKYAYPLLVRPDGRVCIDLHRHLLPGAAFDLAGFWDRSRPSEAEGYRLPAAEDLLLHTGAHFFKDRLRRSSGSFGQLADVAWLCHRHAVDWDQLVARAQACGLHGRLFLALDATNELIAPVVPPSALAALCPSSYSPSQGRRFIQRRVLDTRTWADPGSFAKLPGNRLNANRRPFRRVLPSHQDLASRYGRSAGGAGSYARLYLARLRAAAPGLRPSRLPGDLLLTRWMRSLA